MDIHREAGRVGLERRREARGLDATELALAAGLVEMMCNRERWGTPPAWTAAVPPAPRKIFLVSAAFNEPELRVLCERNGPEPLRRRGLLAPPDFLTLG